MDIRDALLKAKDSQLVKSKRNKFLEAFNYSFNSLEGEYKEIFSKTYLEKAYQFWWLDYYCKSSYYRKRIIAVTSFVHLFELVHENINDYSFNSVIR